MADVIKLIDPLKPSTWEVVGQDADGHDVMLCPATGKRMVQLDDGILYDESDLFDFVVEIERTVVKVGDVELRATDRAHAERLALLVAEDILMVDDEQIIDPEYRIASVKERR